MLWWKPGMVMEAYVWGVRHAVVMGHAYEESSEEPPSQEAFHASYILTISWFPFLSCVISLQQCG